MSLGDYLRAIGRNWIAIALLAVVGGLAGFALASVTPDTYRSTSSVLVTSDQGTSTSELVQGSTYVQNLVSTYVILATSEIVLQPVIDDLDLDTTVQSLASTVSASSPMNSVIIDVSAVSRDPEVAADIAAAVTRSLTAVVEDEVSPQAENGEPTVRLTTIQGATQPVFPIAPNTRLYTLLGALVGLGVGVLLAIVRSLAWHTIRTPEDIAEISSAPVVGEVVDTKRDVTLPRSILVDPLGIEAESLRSLAANLSFLKVGEKLRSIVVTSASPGESKSSIVTALGVTLAESSKRVLLVDADLRHPSLASLTQLEGSVGLTNVLIGDVPLSAAVQPWAIRGLDVLTAGSVPPNPGQLLASEAMRAFLAGAQSEYDVIIVDSAPVLSVSDATWLGHMTDGAFVVTRYERTTSRALRRVTEAMAAATVPVLGLVITRMPRRVRTRYGNTKYGLDDHRRTRFADDAATRTPSPERQKTTVPEAE